MLKVLKRTALKQKRSYTKSGSALTEKEFISLLKDAEESGYMSLEDFKKKCEELTNLK